MTSKKRVLAMTINMAIILLVTSLFGPGLMGALFVDWEADLEQDLPTHAEAHLGYVTEHLEEPFDGYGSMQVLAPQFDIIAMSHMAAGLMNIATAQPERRKSVAPLTAELVRRGLSVAPYGKPPHQTKDLGEHNLYHSHLNLILGIHRFVSGSDKYDDLHRRLTIHLRERSLADGDWHARSYADVWLGKWPADQSVTLASLYVYDQIYGTNLSDRPVQGWLTEMKRRTDPKLGLHHSAIFGEIWYARIPRGCALSWTILYMAQFAPEEARQLYARYREHSREVGVPLGAGVFLMMLLAFNGRLAWGIYKRWWPADTEPTPS